MRDIKDRQDIEYLVDTFYKKVLKDELISNFFTEVVVLDWELHIPIMYDFWESMVFGKAKYKGNPMLKHIELDRKRKLRPEHFERWLQLWEVTIAELFNGEKADEALSKARQIAGLMRLKIDSAQR